MILATKMNKRTQDHDPYKQIFDGFKDPFKSNPYVDPLKTVSDAYKDPLSVSKESYEDPVKSVVHRPEYHEYVLPDIDPLTGKPRRHRQPEMTKKEEEPKKTKQTLPKSYYRFLHGSSVDSVQRTLKIQESLNF